LFHFLENSSHMQNHIAEWRKRRRMRQAQLAHALGVDPYRISQWEHGVYLPRIDVILEMARVLDCRVEDLFSL